MTYTRISRKIHQVNLEVTPTDFLNRINPIVLPWASIWKDIPIRHATGYREIILKLSSAERHFRSKFKWIHCQGQLSAFINFIFKRKPVGMEPLTRNLLQALEGLSQGELHKESLFALEGLFRVLFFSLLVWFLPDYRRRWWQYPSGCKAI